MNALNHVAVWIHDLDPFIFQINGFGPRWYGLSYIAGLMLGWWIICRWCKTQRLPMEAEKVQDLVMAFGFGMIIGGRIGYCLFYDTSLLGFSSDFPFWKTLAVWGGGMASHGGIVGMFLGT
ncbi:MAG: prolipoprotein diacylglyceryl transferase, partial [Planctomycetes bacterium]|nr:prolipoprotein diacylglyceryl transferase [Planctomycetota bacterium]